MDEQLVRAEPLEYYSSEQTSWRPVVRACIYIAIVHAALLLLVLASQFMTIIRTGNAMRLTQDGRSVLGVGLELLVGISCVAVIIGGSVCARFSRTTNIWVLYASTALAGALVLRDALRLWIFARYAGFGLGTMELVSYVAGLSEALLIPLLTIWLMRRPEARRLFGS